jgi:hypothetical protein
MGQRVTSNSETGADTFIFRSDFGNDSIADFEAGPGVGDVIQFDASLFTDFSDILAHTVDTAQGAVITIDINTLTLYDVARSQLHPNDFSII